MFRRHYPTAEPRQELAEPTREPTETIPGLVDARNAGTPLDNDPRRNATFEARRPVRFPLTFPVQNAGLGVNGRQSGAGRPIIPARLSMPIDQSVTPMPDGRIIARPMPTAGVDARQVVKPK